MNFNYRISPKGQGACEMSFRQPVTDLSVLARFARAFQTITGNETCGGALDACVFLGKSAIIRKFADFPKNKEVCKSIAKEFNSISCCNKTTTAYHNKPNQK